jgi:hypothetical protein
MAKKKKEKKEEYYWEDNLNVQELPEENKPEVEELPEEVEPEIIPEPIVVKNVPPKVNELHGQANSRLLKRIGK